MGRSRTRIFYRKEAGNGKQANSKWQLAFDSWIWALGFGLLAFGFLLVVLDAFCVAPLGL